jgi:hypothetical protein
MLMDHTDPEGNSIVRRFDLLDLAINQDLTFIRLVESVGDTHRRGFSGAVFTHNGVNRSRLHDDVYMVVSKDVSEAFCYVSKFEHRFVSGQWSVVSCYSNCLRQFSNRIEIRIELGS